MSWPFATVTIALLICTTVLAVFAPDMLRSIGGAIAWTLFIVLVLMIGAKS